MKQLDPIYNSSVAWMSMRLVIPPGNPEQSILFSTSEEEQPENRSQPPKVGIREFLEPFGTQSFPETIDGKQQMIV